MTLPVTRDVASPAVVFLDGLGERVRDTGPDGQALEVLRLRPEFLEVAAFESGLRERAARVLAFRDPSFAPIVRVDRASPFAHALEVVSARVGGRRLATVLAEVEAGREEIAFEAATILLRQLVAAVARLHLHARDIGHGALAPERLVLGADGRLVIVEHVLGGALEQLQWPRRRLWRDLRVAMPPAACLPRFDQQADLAQVGVVALALFAGRPLGDEDYPEGLATVLHEVSDRVAHAEPTLAPAIASWLVRALQIEGRSFGSMREAAAALDDVLAPPALRAPGSGLRAASAVMQRDSRARLKPEAQSQKPVLVPRASCLVPSPIANRQSSIDNPQSPIRIPQSPVPSPQSPSWWSVLRMAFILVALGATTVAGTVRYLTSPPAMAEAGIRSAPSPGAVVTHPSARSHSRRAVSANTDVMMLDAELLAARKDPAPAGDSGWIAVSAPVDMEITEQGRTLGVTRSGRLELAPGWHELDIANPTLDFRETRDLNVKSGATTPLDIYLPFGVVDLNATPWAEVWLDGERLGETPIGGLSLPIGPHEFVFRHPDLGERRQAVSIRAGEPVRVTVDLTRQ